MTQVLILDPVGRGRHTALVIDARDRRFHEMVRVKERRGSRLDTGDIVSLPVIR
jgi:hypothetical protein